MIQETIEEVRTCRNNKIKMYREKHVVLEYFRQHHAFELSDRKYNFIVRELNELMVTPVDLVHYSSVITEFKESANAPGLDQQCDQLVMQELVKIFRKYTF
jgi:hypothetical protein